MATVNQRRFEEVNLSDPKAVKSLSGDHPAMIESTTLFKSSIVQVADSERLFISGHNNRKIGKMVTKGAWRGFPIYTLTLTERDTCPSHCHMLDTCYGNAMPFARRHPQGLALEQRIEAEIKDLAKAHFKGFVVRLHVLGDFYSVGYVRMWRGLMRKHKMLHVYGYSRHSEDAPKAADKEIFWALDNLKAEFATRFRLRWSRTSEGADHTQVIDYVPAASRVAEGFVCPAEREKGACCASCALCWSPEMAAETIVFVKHGMGSRKSEVIAKKANGTNARYRPIEPIMNIRKLAGRIGGALPEIVWVSPSELRVDETYQRNLSGGSIRLITNIVTSWDWAHFKPPVVCRNEDGGLDVIDGQHTAIAAATRPDIEKIPVMMHTGATVHKRAAAFISHNKNRVRMTPQQIFYASIVAGDAEAKRIDRLCLDAGVKILKWPPSNAGSFKPGETLALGALQSVFRSHGAEVTEKALRALCKNAPVRSEDIRAVTRLLTEPAYEEITPEALQEAFRAKTEAAFAREVMDIMASTGMKKWEAKAIALYKTMQ